MIGLRNQEPQKKKPWKRPQNKMLTVVLDPPSAIEFHVGIPCVAASETFRVDVTLMGGFEFSFIKISVKKSEETKKKT